LGYKFTIHVDHDALMYMINKPLDKQKKCLIFKAQPYTMIGGILYKKDKDEVLRRCINPSKVPLILKGCHHDVGGGHFASLITAQKALQSGYWWPTLFSDTTR
jgi:hypothetical protein